MPLFKKQIPVALFVFQLLPVLNSRDVATQFATPRASGAISDSDVRALDIEILPFVLAVWFELFLEYFGSRDEDTMGALAQQFAIGVAKDLERTGAPTSEAAKTAVALIARMSEFLDDATARQAASERNADRFYFLTLALVERVAGGPPSLEDAPRTVQLIEFGRDECVGARAVFEEDSRARRYALS